MEQSPSGEANSSPTDQYISCLLYSLNVRFCNHKTPPLVPILTRVNPVHFLSYSSFEIRFNIILSSTPMSPT